MLESDRKREELRDAQRTRAVSVRDQIAAAIRATGVEVETSDAWDAQITRIGGAWYGVSVRPQVRGFHFIPTGRLIVTIGRSGSRRAYPEPKAGFDVVKLAKIAAAGARNEAEGDAVRAERMDRYHKNQVACDALRREFEKYHPSLGFNAGADCISVSVVFPDADAARSWMTRAFNREEEA